MSEFVSFPRTGIEDHERSPSIYNMVFSAASHMFHSIKDSESGDAQSKTPPLPATPKSSASSYRSSISTHSVAIPPSPIVKVNGGPIEHAPGESRPKSQVETKPVPIRHSSTENYPTRSQLHKRQHSNTAERTEMRHSRRASNNSERSLHPPASSASSRSTSQRSVDIPSDIQERPQLSRTSTTSSATVGLSSEQAVPHSPTTIPIPINSSTSSAAASSVGTHPEPVAIVGNTASSAMRSRSSSTGTQHSMSTQSVHSGMDRESMFSVSSTSASRAYWASQYSRTRSRAAPGRSSREFWMKDESATSCFNCNRAFTTFRRKHHCRVCGQIFCSACTDLVDGELCGAPRRRVRCCKACEDALAQHTSSEDEGEMSFWSQTPQDDSKWPDVSPSTDENAAAHGDTLGSLSSSGLGERAHSNGTAHGHHSMPSMSSDSYGIYNNSNSKHNRLTGGYDEANGIDNDEDMADAYGPAESYSRSASPVVPDEQMFARSFLGPNYHHQARVRSRSYSQLSRDDDHGNSSYYGSQNSVGGHSTTNMVPFVGSTGSASTNYGSATGNSSGYVNGGTATATSNISTYPDEHTFPSSNAMFPNSATVELNNAAITYSTSFLDQLLKDSESDPEQWAPVSMAPILELASGLHSEMNDKVSPREWVKIKRIPGGKPHDIDYINGIVFTHSSARRSMAKRIVMPRISLITFPIEYSRNERYVSLEPVVAQEHEYLKKLVARIAALRPNLLSTSNYVCGIALSMLESEGVAVAQNVRESALFRLSRITRSDILTSIDRLSVAPQLGSCQLFEQRSYRYENFVKTFSFFFVRPADPGRCALVRGDPEISSVIKVVLEVMAEICYSSKAETALMRDQFVTVPSLTEPPAMVLSSSPFIDYGVPFLQKKTRELEDLVVDLGNQLDVETSKEQRYIITCRLDFVRQKWMETFKLWECIENANPFMFNPSSHQNLIILYSSVCIETATPCVGPDSQLVEFYLNTDQTSGKFVETNISQANESCPDGCNRPMCAHYKSYVNGNGMVTVKTEQLSCKVPGLEDSILMWSYCNICEQQMPIVPMSSTTWKCSMGKYLELSFYGEPLRMRASTCTHNVYRDHTRFFGWHGYALKIEYSNVELNEITGPSRVSRWNPQAEIDMKYNAYQEWSRKLKRFWASLMESLNQVKIEGLEDAMIELSQQKSQELRAKAASDREESVAVLENLFNETEPYDYLSLNKFSENYQQLVDQWHSDIADFDGQFFPTERDIRRVTAQHIRGSLGEDPSKPAKTPRRDSNISIPATISSRNGDSGDEKLDQNAITLPALPSTPPNISPERSIAVDDGGSVHDGEVFHMKKISQHDSDRVNEISSPKTRTKSDLAQSPKVSLQPNNKVVSGSPQKSSNVSESIEGSSTANVSSPIPLPPSGRLKPKSVISKSPGSSSSSNGSPSSVKVKSRYGNDINLSIPGLNQASLSDGGNRVAILAEHFEELSREFERERIREKSRLRERQRAIRLRHAHPVAEVFEDVTDAIEDWPQQSNSNQLDQAETNGVDKTCVESILHGLTDDANEIRVATNNASQDDKRTSDVSSGLGMEAPADEQQELCPQSSRKTNGVRSTSDAEGDQSQGEERNTKEEESEEDYKRPEPTKLSLIHTLANFWAERSSTRWNGIEYVLQPKEHFFTNSPVVIRDSEPSSLIAFCLSLPDYTSRIQDFYKVTSGGNKSSAISDRTTESEESNSISEDAMLRQTGTHMRYHFERNTVKVSCKIFFSEQFDALRRKCQVGHKFIQSLSRCSPWESTGGKSGSAFLKTLDDRLILKELSHGEFDSFVNFAPSYFEYMSQALFHDLPTVLSKIFGVYQITIRNTSTSQQVKMYVLVMENSFYGTRFNKVFDLKGSMRNRKVTETGRENEVSLDENMVEYIYESPVFVREQSKRMLRTSLYNDTLFLTKMNVMDYSLIVGLDEENNVIVAGIIDYIRTYTWDKKIESWVKTRAATGGFKEPTVVSPKQYKGRFRESMERYFVMVPDCWSQPGTT